MSCVGQEARHGGGLLHLPSTMSLGTAFRAVQEWLPIHPQAEGEVLLLVLSRKVGEELIVGNGIRLMAVAIQRDRVRVGISAPKEVVVVV